MMDFYAIFATFVAFVTGVIAVTESVNNLFKINSQRGKLITSWVISIALACIGFALQIGIFSDIGAIDTWQGWVKTIFIGLGCALAANKIYNREEIWNFIQAIFSVFKSKK